MYFVFLGQGEVFRRNHLIRLAESIKTKQSIDIIFLKNDRFLLLCLSNQIYWSKNILLNCCCRVVYFLSPNPGYSTLKFLLFLYFYPLECFRDEGISRNSQQEVTHNFIIIIIEWSLIQWTILSLDTTGLSMRFFFSFFYNHLVCVRTDLIISIVYFSLTPNSK